MVGYRKNPKVGNDFGVMFFVLPEGWREINKGRDYKKSAKLAQSVGWLDKTQENKIQALVRIPGMNNKPMRVYIVNCQVLSHSDEM